MDLEKLLNWLKQQAPTGQGIGLASAYLAGLSPCVGDKACNARFLQVGTPEQWDQALKNAARQPVYGHQDMILTGGVMLDGDRALKRFGDYQGEKKPREPSPGACMDFEGVITSRARDRDRDVLESEGAEPDERMPLLWQHIPMLPIGKLVEVTVKNKQRVCGHFSIVDSELGRDSAQLVEFGALRLSHGFIPTEYEPLEKSKDDESMQFPGWHVLKFKIVETSLVSVPSNEDAVITAFSRGKLFHPLIKSWAQALKDMQPTRASVPAEVPGHKCGCQNQGQGDQQAGQTQEDRTPKNPAFEGLKPFPSEHSCRLRNPADFKPNSFRRTTRKHNGKTYSIIMAKLKGDDAMTEQAYRYPKDSWTPAEAKAHCKDHEGSTFEAASDDEAAFVAPELEAVCEIDQRGINLEPLRYLHGYTVEGIRYHQPKDAGKNAMLVFDARRHEDNPDQLARRLAAALVEGKHLSGSAVSSLLAMLAPLKAQAEVDMDNAVARMAESELAALLN